MTTEFLRPEHPEDEDSWSDLAEDLFGIDFAQTPQSGEFVSPEELLAEDDQSPPDSEESKDPTLAVETDETVDAEQSEETEESPLPAIETESTEQATSPSIQDIPDVEGSGDEGPTSERDRSTDKTERDDNFWDPLNDWNWDEGKVQAGKTDQDSSEPEQSRRKRASFERQKPVSSRIVREEDDFSSAEDLHEEYIDDSDFGAGLLQEEDEPVSESEISDSAEEQTEQTEQAEQTRSKAQKSRRRRRRPRRAKQETGDVETVSAGDEQIEMKEDSSDGDESSDQDDAAEATPRKRPSRRRSSRSRMKRSDSPASEHDSQIPEPTAESEEFGESIQDEELEPVSEENSRESQDLPLKSEGQSKTSHRDVPTWEEAISYLLSPKPASEADSKSKTAPASTATKDTSESSKSPGRRRRRRRH